MAMAVAMGRDGGDEGWRYIYEALQNVRCLQLLLFHPAVTPLQDCRNCAAVVRYGSLRCAWDSPDGTPNALSVPLPACLLDLSTPARCWTRQDHVEVRLGLLSLNPALHMLQLSLEDEGSGFDACREVGDAKPFSVDFVFLGGSILQCKHDNTMLDPVDEDAQALESNEEVQFFCRKCTCKLTNTPFRRVLEVPSMDWREVSEHFYGNCCCASFGAQAEFLVARFQQLLTPSEETCLVASTTCIVHKVNVIVSDGDRDSFPEPAAAQSLERIRNDNVSCVSPSPKVTCADDYFYYNDSEHESNNLSAALESDSKLNHYQNGGEETTLVKERNQVVGGTCKNAVVNPSSEEVAKIGEDATGAQIYSNSVQEGRCESSRVMLPTDGSVADGTRTNSVAEELQEVCGTGNKVSPEGFGSRTHQDTQEGPCCSTSCSFSKPVPTDASSLKEAKEASPESLGNGFMTGPGSQSEVLDWEPFLCRKCTSLVGARRGDCSKKGLQFFKCQISTHESVQSTSNVFREHTLERLFTHELEKNTESNSSYRYVVRSFQTGAALLQLVLLNQSALVSSGTCLLTSTSNSEDTAKLDKKPRKVPLETVAKFMYCDCRTLDLDELRLIDKWAYLQKADDIFMLEAVAEALIDLLKSHQLAYPPCCQSFQQFSLSFLTK